MKSAILALLCILVGCGGKTTPVTGAASERSGTVFLGDSIFIRWNLNEYFPGKNYVDAGIAGQTTSQILERLRGTISGQNVCGGDNGVIHCQTIAPPRVIVIYAGWNNLFLGKDPQVTISDIETMVSLCQQSDVTPIIATVYHYDPAFGGAGFDGNIGTINGALRDYAATSHVNLIDLEQLFLSQSNYTLDGVHPNPDGYSQMATSFAATVPIQK